MNVFGDKLRVSIFGESHGKAIGVVLDGAPAGLGLCETDFEEALRRRKYGDIQELTGSTTPRKEEDRPIFLSGVYEGVTTGAPLTIIFENKEQHSGDYSQFREMPRPGHADFVAAAKFGGFNDIRGGGHFSGRVTLALVAAGVVAKKMLYHNSLNISELNKQILHTTTIHGCDYNLLSINKLDENILHSDNNNVADCNSLNINKLNNYNKDIESNEENSTTTNNNNNNNNNNLSTQNITFKAEITEIGGEANPEKWPELLKKTKTAGDSVGSIVECRINNVPVGLGEPFFNSVEALIAHLAFSIPGVKGIEFGDLPKFGAAATKGSEFNDRIISKTGKTASNHSGGINGGITNGNPVIFRVCIRPTASIAQAQQTINLKTGSIEELKITGRHDSCIALRCPVIIESIAALAFAELI